jgi:hypothetical protein
MYTNFIGNCVTPLYGQAIDGDGLTNVEGQKRFIQRQMVTLELFNCTQILL